MDSARPENTKHLLSLKDASEKLGVTVDQLLKWNDYNILKPTITLSGEIGYTKEQIENFLMIQRNAEQNKSHQVVHTLPHPRKELLPPMFPSPNLTVTTPGIPPREYSRNILVSTEKFSLKSITENFSLRSFIALSSCSFLFFIGIFITSAQHLPRHQVGNDKGATSGKAPGVTLAANSGSNKTPAGKLSNQADVLGESKLSQLNDEFGTNPTQALPPEERFELPVAVKENTGASFAGGEFASRSNCPTCVDEQPEKESIFDEKGNIKGEPDTKDHLAVTTLGSPDPATSRSSSSQTASITLLMCLTLFGLLSLVYIFRSQFAYAGGTGILIQPHYNPASSLHQEKRLLEIDQKTDGTVVLHFQGAEHKVSKPELDSESDQFITRLMELTKDSTKEIDYDAVRDGKYRFNAPLSKLVTRLGFVGIKRDIFFPRTSKNKVLFRRYVTSDDLLAMSLKPEQIAQYL
jgi:hypothetical protein